MTQTQGKPKVISISKFQSAPSTRATAAITQERLQIGQRLVEEQRRILEDLQKFKLEIEGELATGADIEAGELTFDRDLKLVRRRQTTTPRVLQVSAR